MTTPTPGLYQKFEVKRIVGEDKPGEQFFVLSPTHDPLARRALKAYALECRGQGLQQLANEIIAGVKRCEDGLPFYIEAAS